MMVSPTLFRVLQLKKICNWGFFNTMTLYHGCIYLLGDLVADLAAGGGALVVGEVGHGVI